MFDLTHHALFGDTQLAHPLGNTRQLTDLGP